VDTLPPPTPISLYVNHLRKSHNAWSWYPRLFPSMFSVWISPISCCRLHSEDVILSLLTEGKKRGRKGTLSCETQPWNSYSVIEVWLKAVFGSVVCCKTYIFGQAVIFVSGSEIDAWKNQLEMEGGFRSYFWMKYHIAGIDEQRGIKNCKAFKRRFLTCLV